MAKTAVLGIRRHFTKAGVHPYDMLTWTKQDSVLTNPMTGETVFEQLDVEFPDTWSLNAINIVSQKYFCGTPGSKERESSLKHLVDRVADTITRHGLKEGYFVDEDEADTYNAELKYILATQRAAFNSPVWFNIGAPDRAQQASACFILAVEDTMPSILNWYKEEGMVFKGGSGAGLNLSAIRSSQESLGNSAGTASGPLSFMRGADSSAGAIKSGGKTRRAAKMVILNAEHPDVEEFIWCKAIEERKSRALEEAGFDMSLNGKDAFSVQYQNANNSVRVNDEFMQAVLDDEMYEQRAVTDGRVIRRVKARDIWRQIAEAAWECADPGLQFDTTINKWHTTPNEGRINGSNPCSEYMHLDNSACNLASLNLLHFLNEDGTFDIEAFKHTTEIVFTGQEILVGYSSYPTENITKNAKKYRELGIGYANLGAMLMAQGLPYDSDEGRAQAAAITALLTGHSYATSAKIAHRVGPFAGFAKDSEGMINVLKMHRRAVNDIDAGLVSEDLLSAAANVWDNAVEDGEKYGVRNSQASVLAPTGTIGLMMDCDTTGIEPDLGLVKIKKLVGGGIMSIVNQTIPRALKTLGYSKSQTDDIIAFIDTEKSIIGAPHLKKDHYDVFACSMGDNTIHYMGHVKMMSAVQPFLSGAISKTVNMPEEATVEEIEELHLQSWKLGLKAVAIYRDNCKVAQPLSTAKKDEDADDASDEASASAAPVATAAPVAAAPATSAQSITDGYVLKGAVRRRLPKQRPSRTYEFSVSDLKGHFTIGEFEDGTPGELFMTVAKQGSTLSGVMDGLGRAISYGLQYGVPLSAYVRGLTNLAFAPSGLTDDPEVQTANSLLDYIFRRLAIDYLSFEERLELGLASIEDMPMVSTEQATLPVAEEGNSSEAPKAVAAKAAPVAPVVTAPAPTAEPTQTVQVSASAKTDAVSAGDEAARRLEELRAAAPAIDQNAPLCTTCGMITQRSGSCYVCTACGSTSGCS